MPTALPGVQRCIRVRLSHAIRCGGEAPDWRINSRRAFPAGYTVYMYLRQNEILGIPRQLAEARARSMTGLLEHLGINKKDIERPVVRSTASGHVASEVEGRFFNEAGISINPRCPHVCCES